jgi:predicted dehydrogenase
MSAALRAGLVGLGTMGRHHARVLRRLDGVQLVAVADWSGDPYRAAEGLPLVSTVDQLLDYQLDYCVVAVPTASHSTIGHTLAAAGVHALIEKPLTPSLAEAVTLAETFDAAGLVGAVGHTERYNPAVLAMRARLAHAELGIVYQMATRRQGPFPPRICDVGVVQDLATHDIDLVTWVTGRPVASITARTTSRSGRHHEDLVATVGDLTDGTITSHLINWLSPMKERVTVATGERGCLVADTLHADLTYYANGSTTTEWAAAEVFRGVTEGDITRYAIAKREPLLTEHEAFRDALLGGDAEIVTLWEAAHTVAVAEAVLTSAASGQTVAPDAPRRRQLVDRRQPQAA